MKRWAIIITICILLGAIINVALAWWFAIRLDEFAPPSSSKIGLSYDGPGYTQWNTSTVDWTGSSLAYSQSFDSRNFTAISGNELSSDEVLPYWAEMVRPDPDTTEPYPFNWEHAVAHGWPMRSILRSWEDKDNHETNYSYCITWKAPSWIRGNQTNPTAIKQPVYLPLKIIWHCFIANTLLYAITPLLIFNLPRKFRSYLRTKRKQCTKCGYPIGQSEICTECGSQLKIYN